MPGLAGRLRAETHALHVQVERSPFMASLLRGRLGLPAYCLLMRNLYPVYAGLESGLVAHRGLPALAPLYLPPLWRTQRIAHDLASLWGDGWQTSLDLLEPAERYSARLTGLAHRRPALLAAHAYVRYLGDLSGGQLLRDIVARSLQLPDDRGLSFFDFGDAAQARAQADAFRRGLDLLGVHGDDEQALVDEAQAAFVLHAELFGALAGAISLSP